MSSSREPTRLRSEAARLSGLRAFQRLLVGTDQDLAPSCQSVLESRLGTEMIEALAPGDPG